MCEAYQKKVIKYLYYAVGSKEDALDLTQEVFIIVYKNIDILKKHENVGGYIFQTAKYQASNHLRKMNTKKTREVVKDIDHGSHEADLLETILSNYDRQIDVDSRVSHIIDGLSTEKKKLYRMHYIEEKSYRDISKILSISEPAVRMKFVRLRKEIKTMVKKYAQANFDMDGIERQEKIS